MPNTSVLKRHLGRLFFALALFLPFQGEALEHWFVPRHGMQKAWVKNPSSEPQFFWISGPVESYAPEWEKTIEIPARSTTEVTHLAFKGTFFHGKASSPSTLQLLVQDIKGQRIEWPRGAGFEHALRAKNPSSWILTNLTPFPQTIRGAGSPFQLQGFEQKVIPLPAGQFQVKSDSRLQITEWSSKGFQPQKASSKPVRLSPPPGAYFVVSNPNQTSSFTVRITNPDLIRQARRQIQEPHLFLPRILFGEVRPGHQNQNRDWASNSKHPWSWSIDVLQFGEMASQACDGGAEMLEEVLLPWIRSESLICFWSYKITRELTKDQVATGRP